MARRRTSPKIDDELFNDIYGKVCTGPPRAVSNTKAVNAIQKMPSVDVHSDEEDGFLDPNALPTDFTSREAKIRQAKAKNAERHQKRRRKEERICKICRKSDHFTQGCPSTLGAIRKSADFSQRVPVQDETVRALFSEKVISQIEKDVGCEIRMKEEWLSVSGKDRLILSEGVDALHKVIQEGVKDKSKETVSSHRPMSKSPDRNPAGSQLRRSEPQKSHSTAIDTSRYHASSSNYDKVFEDNVREDLQKLRGSPHARAYANDGVKGRSTSSKSSPRETVGGEAVMSYDDHNRNSGMHATDHWNSGRIETDFHSESKFDYPSYPELEMEFNSETVDLRSVRDKYEDEENYKHRECIKELQEKYTKNLAIMRGVHAKQWEEFFQLDMQRRQARHNAYSQSGFSQYEPPGRSAQSQYMGVDMAVDARHKYQFHGENYLPSMPQKPFNDFQHQRHGDYGKH